MIGLWLETQPERVRAVLDPSWSPVRAAVVLAARHEQAAVKELDEFFSPNPRHNPRIWSPEFLGNLVPARCFAPDMGVVPAWRAEELSVSDKMNKSRLRGVCHNLREVLPGTNDGPQDAEHYVDRAIARIAQLEADLAIARAAMSGAGTPPPMPEPCECNWPDACSCGADARRTQPLPNDPRLP